MAPGGRSPGGRRKTAVSSASGGVCRTLGAAWEDLGDAAWEDLGDTSEAWRWGEEREGSGLSEEVTERT